MFFLKKQYLNFKIFLTPQFIYPFGLFIVLFILYILSFDFRLGDPLFYAKGIETGKAIRWAEPGHLIYRPLSWLIYKLFQIFGYTGRAITILQLESAFFGAIGAGGFFYLVYHLVKDTKVALFSVSILAFSHSYWTYSGNGSAYVPSTCIMIFAFILLFKLSELSKHQRKTLYVLAISLISALSALFWLPQVFCFPAILLGIVLIPQRLSYYKKFTLASIYLLGLFLFLIMPILLGLIFINGCKSLSELLIALTATGHGKPFQLNVLNFIRTFYGVALAFVTIGDIGLTVKGLITGDFNLVGNKPFILMLDTCKFLVVWAACLLTILYLILKWKTMELKASSGDLLLTNRFIRTVLLTLGIWILPFFSFSMFWPSADLERLLPALPAAILAASIALAHIINTLRRPLILKLIKTISIGIFVALPICNFSGFFIPARNFANDKAWKIAESLGQEMNPNDMVITWGRDMEDVEKFLFYFADRRCFTLINCNFNHPTIWKEKLAKVIENSWAKGGKVFIHNRVITEKDVPESRWSENEHPGIRQEIRKFFSQYSKSLAWIIEDEIFWEVME